MTHKSGQLPQNAGFTLVEMLVALVLIGLLSGALFGGLRFAARATDRATATTDHASAVALAYGFLQAQLGNAQPYPATADPKDRQIVFDGAPDQIDVITTAPSRLAIGGFFRLRLVAANSGGQLSLVAAWREAPRRAAAASETPLEPTVLLDNLRVVAFAFFGTTDPEVPDEWHDQWQDVTALPKMVRLRIQFADGWQAPDLVVAPRLAEKPNVNG
jgi:general secretion pathway protein J